MDNGYGGDFTLMQSSNSDSFIARNIISGLNYKFKVRGVNLNAPGIFSDEFDLKSCVAPFGVKEPILVDQTSTTVSIRWIPPENDGGCPIISYALFRDDGANGPISTAVDTATVNNKPYLFEHTLSLAALKGKTVRIQLEASNELGSTLSPAYLSVLVSGVPPKPAPVTVDQQLVTGS